MHGMVYIYWPPFFLGFVVFSPTGAVGATELLILLKSLSAGAMSPLENGALQSVPGD